MSTFLVILGAIVAILLVFARLVRARAQRRMADVEIPAELLAARRGAAPAPPGRPVPVSGAPPPPPARQARGAPHFMLIYDLGPDFRQRREPYRGEHLALAWKAAEAGDLVLAGALEESAGQAFLLFRGSREAALRFAAADPYVKQGLVRGFRVLEWHTVVGAQASMPTRPAG